MPSACNKYKQGAAQEGDSWCLGCASLELTQGRQRKRAGIRLRDFTITEKTRLRYDSAVGRILPYLAAQPNLYDLDAVLCDWIELQWVRGDVDSHGRRPFRAPLLLA